MAKTGIAEHRYRCTLPGLILPDARLRNLPASIGDLHLVHLDGLTMSADMVGLAYHRLERLLAELSTTTERQAELRLFPQVFSDAWQVVDAAARFDRLIHRLDEPFAVTLGNDFSATLETARRLRNRLQHLDDDLGDITKEHAPVFGTLSWTHVDPHASPPVCQLQVASAASTRRGGLPIPDLSQIEYHTTIDCIELAGRRHRVSLTTLVTQIALAVVALEGRVAAVCGSDPRAPANVRAILDFDTGPTHDP